MDDLIHWAKCALLDLNAVMPEVEPSGDRTHPGWQTIRELDKIISEIDPEWNSVLE